MVVTGVICDQVEFSLKSVSPASRSFDTERKDQATFKRLIPQTTTGSWELDEGHDCQSRSAVVISPNIVLHADLNVSEAFLTVPDSGEERQDELEVCRRGQAVLHIELAKSQLTSIGVLRPSGQLHFNLKMSGVYRMRTFRGVRAIRAQGAKVSLGLQHDAEG